MRAKNTTTASHRLGKCDCPGGCKNEGRRTMAKCHACGRKVGESSAYDTHHVVGADGVASCPRCYECYEGAK